MKYGLSTLLGAALFAGAFAVHAQTPPEDPGKDKGSRQRMHDCSKAPDPKACEERREKMRAAMKDAHKACEGKQGAERRECMSQQMCAKAKDPAQCMAKAKERGERHKERAEMRQKMREACKGKEGEEMKKCIREQRNEHRGRGERPKA